MRDIQQVLARWGAWAANNHENVYWRPIAAGFSELVPSKIKSREQCIDDDGLIISRCIASLNKKNLNAHNLLFDYYIFGKKFMKLASEHGCSDCYIGRKLQNAEGIFEGYPYGLGRQPGNGS
ncbi:Phage antitermination protein Q [Sodalis glossinidius str. 'morsitans']|uniref:Phage antitermination protein Q n=1 Tax=Sodalis glossinidius (strain morsitans) TaxID=343509 RepID=A0A193QJ52_SODGM|nr:Phage antitermination protein Q [Sodalis glossinidius str. 'morsitans']